MQKEEKAQLRMVWTKGKSKSLPEVNIPEGYVLRTYIPGDEKRFYELMDLSGWANWDDKKLEPWKKKLLPDCWFMIIHEESEKIIATAMGLHDHQHWHGIAAQFGWLACDPKHRGKGLGLAISAAVIRRAYEIGFKHIWLGSEDYRLAALKIYFKLGFIPELYDDTIQSRWENICKQINWPYTPEKWKSK